MKVSQHVMNNPTASFVVITVSGDDQITDADIGAETNFTNVSREYITELSRILIILIRIGSIGALSMWIVEKRWTVYLYL